MKHYSEILEAKKRIEFNLTEQEVLIRLISDANSIGEKIQKDMKRLREISSKLVKIFEKEKLILKENDLEQVKIHFEPIVGIDGSFQLVGGSGGKWYAPISVVRVIFEKGMNSQPHIDFDAFIREIDETKYPAPRSIATLMMLGGESKAILNWGSQNKPSFIFIDGPVVDPPVLPNLEEDKINYVKDRCESFRVCLKKSIIIGCVKRSRDRFYIDYLESLLSNGHTKNYLSQFFTDQFLIAFIFAHIRSNGYLGPLFTKWIDVSSANDVYNLYKKYGIYVTCLFFQKSLMSPVLRLDIPFLNPPENNSNFDEIILQAAKVTDICILPGQDYPLPAFLAHEKCNIREGCAEVLYEEIMTKSRTADPFEQIILTQLR